MNLPSWRAVALFLAFFSILPIWLIDIAPLSDWPFHLAVSNEAYLLLENQIQSNFYHVDYGFLGYSLPHSILIFLRHFTDIFTAGKIFLSLLFILSIFCWYFAFELLDNSKKGYFLLGLVANQSVFYFLGMVSFLFAAHFGILWLAITFSKNISLSKRYAAFFILALVVYLSHGYVFFLLSVPVLVFLFHNAVAKKQKSDAILAIFHLLLILLAVLNTVSNISLERDLHYVTTVNSCNLEQMVFLQHPEFNQKNIFSLEFFSGVYSNLFSILPIGYFVPVISNPLAILSILLLFILIILKAAHAISSESFNLRIPNLSGINISKNYALLCAYFYIHFLIVPFSAASIYFFNERSIPFLTAFMVLSFKSAKLDEILPKVLLAAVSFSLLFHALSFYSGISEQTKIISQVKELSYNIPDNSSVMIFPASWNSRIYFPLSPVQQNPQYHALLLIYNPEIYVSNMFLFQDTFVLRSNFPLFDEFRIWYSSNKELDDAVFEKCYFPIPPNFDYYIDRNMSLVKTVNKSKDKSE